jgi:beta-N-acetylhexosaminidase
MLQRGVTCGPLIVVVMLFPRAAALIGLCAIAFAATPKPVPKTGGPKRPTAAATALAWAHALPLRDKAAQLVIAPIFGELQNTRSRDFRRYVHYVHDLRVGGVIVLGHSINGSVHNAEPLAMAALINRLQKLARVPLLVGADFERGASMRVNSTTAWPQNMAFGAAGDLDDVRFEGAETAREARALGVQWIFAPVADVNNNPDNPIINTRSYGEDPNQVARFVQAYIAGAHSDAKHPVLVTAKHFPGHGDSSEDSHLGLPRLDVTRERLENVELVPFRAAIAGGVDSVMTAHIAVPALDLAGLPATVSSPLLTDTLRHELGFRGLIVTDAMDMLGLSKLFDPGEAAVRALEAGADVLLVPADCERAINAVVAAVKSGRITRKRLDESVARILEAKIRVGLARRRTVNLEGIADVLASPEAAEAAQRVAERALTLVKNDGDLFPLRNPAGVCVAVLTESRDSQHGRTLAAEVKKRAARMTVITLDPTITTDDITALARDMSSCPVAVLVPFVTVGAYKGTVTLREPYTALVNTLTAGKTPVAVVAFGSPYLIRSLPNIAAYIATFSTTTTSEEAVARALFGEIPITGHLPVSIPGIAKLGEGIQVGVARHAE